MTVLLLALAAVATSVAAAVAAVQSRAATRRLRALVRQQAARSAQAATDRAFVIWANWTMLTVTDRDGMIQAATLRQLYTTGYWDRIWDNPVAVALWHGDPDTLTAYADDEGSDRA
ncbi:hypothetical protein ACFCXC_35300 [Streptomyces microflavus]